MTLIFRLHAALLPTNAGIPNADGEPPHEGRNVTFVVRTSALSRFKQRAMMQRLFFAWVFVVFVAYRGLCANTPHLSHRR